MRVEPPTPPVTRGGPAPLPPGQEEWGEDRFPLQEEKGGKGRLRRRVVKKKEEIEHPPANGGDRESTGEDREVKGQEKEQATQEKEQDKEENVLSMEEESALARESLTDKERRVMAAVLSSRRSRSRSSSRMGDTTPLPPPTSSSPAPPPSSPPSSPLPPPESPASSPLPPPYPTPGEEDSKTVQETAKQEPQNTQPASLPRPEISMRKNCAKLGEESAPVACINGQRDAVGILQGGKEGLNLSSSVSAENVSCWRESDVSRTSGQEKGRQVSTQQTNEQVREYTQTLA